jgi:biotin synthase
VAEIYRTPLPSLVFRAQTVHRQFHPEDRVQTCQLLSIKTGGCPEDCAYCPQSAHYDAGVAREGLLDPEHVIGVAREAAGRGVTRFCMGAAWRQAPEGREFEKVLQMVRGVSSLGLEVCCTLGMLTERQAEQLKEAGLSAYNHNLDTSPEFYGSIITTRVYDERLSTLAAVRKAGITVCCGGILGMGEREEDRIGLLQQLASLKPGARGGHPAGEGSAARPAGDGAGDCDGADFNAGFACATGRWAQAAFAGSGDAVFSGGGEFDFCGREIVDHAESRPR